MRHKHPLTMRARQVRSCQGGPFIAGSIYPKLPGLVQEQPFNVSLFSLHKDMLIIFENLILINECNFRFTNIEVVRTITSVMKSLMKISLFNGVKCPYIYHNEVRITLIFFYYHVISVTLLILIKILFYRF